MFFKQLGIIFLVGIAFVAAKIQPATYGIRTPNDYFHVVRNGDGNKPIYAITESSASGEIWFVDEYEEGSDTYVIQNYVTKKYIAQSKKKAYDHHLYLLNKNREQATRFQIDQVGNDDRTFIVKVANTDLQWSTANGNANEKEIVLSTTSSGTNNQFEFNIILF
ncbi:hypothetical protein BJ944DRAFT_269970 [Cunninghamella echinulata]|nr:hypothetical protein BJ944DRAFT_269970 [Cunninghamella echinulata]